MIRQKKEKNIIMELSERYYSMAMKTGDPRKITDCLETTDYVKKATIVSHQRQSNMLKEGRWFGPKHKYE